MWRYITPTAVPQHWQRVLTLPKCPWSVWDICAIIRWLGPCVCVYFLGFCFCKKMIRLAWTREQGLWWITQDKQVGAKIGLVQTDHRKYSRRACGTCLGSVCFDGKQWSDTHTPSLLEDTTAVCLHVVMTLIARSSSWTCVICCSRLWLWEIVWLFRKDISYGACAFFFFVKSRLIFSWSDWWFSSQSGSWHFTLWDWCHLQSF